MHSPSLDRLLTGVADPSSPLLTFYDMSSGERVELSTTTTANWVAKTSNFLTDDLEADHDTRIRIALPSHWLRWVCLLAAWSVGSTVTDQHADVAITGPALDADEPVRVAASLRPLGARFASAPIGFIDLTAEVPGHGDHFSPLDPPSPDTVALDLSGSPLTHGDLLDITPPDSSRRVCEPADLATEASALVAALKGGGSLVLVTGATSDEIARVAAQERANVA